MLLIVLNSEEELEPSSKWDIWEALTHILILFFFKDKISLVYCELMNGVKYGTDL